MRSIMPMAFRHPPELAILEGLVCFGFGAALDWWPIGLLGAVVTLLGVRDLWRARRPTE